MNPATVTVRQLFVMVPVQGVHCIPLAAHRLMRSIVWHKVEAQAQFSNSQHVHVRFVSLLTDFDSRSRFWKLMQTTNQYYRRPFTGSLLPIKWLEIYCCITGVIVDCLARKYYYRSTCSLVVEHRWVHKGGLIWCVPIPVKPHPLHVIDYRLNLIFRASD